MLPTPVVLQLHEHVYEPAEDSFLLLDCLEQDQLFLNGAFAAPLVLEIGAGSGIVSSFASKLVCGAVLAVDINPHACRQVLRTVGENSSEIDGVLPVLSLVDALQMSLASGLRAHCVDVLIFNPPYVPAEYVPAVPPDLDDPEWLDLALCGGEDGMVVTWAVLDDLDRILSPKGVAYILFCARNRPEEVQKAMKLRGWSAEPIITRKAGWEVLTVVKFSRTQ